MPEFRFQRGDDVLTVRVERSGDHYRVNIGDREYTVEVGKAAPGELAFTVDDVPKRAYISQDGPRRYVAFDANIHTLTPAETTGRKRVAGAGEGSLSAAMPGQVI